MTELWLTIFCEARFNEVNFGLPSYLKFRRTPSVYRDLVLAANLKKQAFNRFGGTL